MISFKTYLQEKGNPLARQVKFAGQHRHFVALSTYRKDKSNKQNRQSLEELKGKLKQQGYGYRKAEGHWEGGKEKSLVVYAKESGDDAGRQLVRDMLQHGRHYNQDSILHHNGEAGHLIGTNETGFPGNKKVVRVGKTMYNKPEAEFQTELRPSRVDQKTGKPRRAPARFTSGD